MISTANQILLKALTIAHIEQIAKDECEHLTILNSASHYVSFIIYHLDSGENVYQTDNIYIKADNQEAVTDKLMEAIKACDKYL